MTTATPSGELWIDNRGWVSDQLRDSQYHSMYRTLRSARLNYSAHSAKFKEEGNVYKLVMDVREFVGGDITVRTAGGTVSVRGKLEVSPEEEEKRRTNRRFDDDTSSSISGKSSSAKTLHRRFTLPVDANCDKVESMLSRDAILTITIPKRTDVHYIPVNIEGEDKENESCVGSRKTHEGTRQPSVKRPSDSPPAPTRKKSQDESVANQRRRRSCRDERDHSKFKPKDFDSEDLTGPILENEKEKNRDENNGKRKRNLERKKEEENLASSRPRRRDKSKYEEVQEINIPIRIDKSEPSDKVFRPSSIHESSEHYSDMSKGFKNSSENRQESDVDMEKTSEVNESKMPCKDDAASVNSNKLSTRPKGSSLFRKDYENFSKPKETKEKDGENKSFSTSLRNLLFRNKDEADKEEENEEQKENRKRNEKIIFPRRESENEIKGDNSENVKNDIWSNRESTPEAILNDYLDKRDSVPSISISRESPASESSDELGKDTKKNNSNKNSENIAKQEGTQTFPLMDRNNLPKESNSEEESPKDKSLEAPKISLFDRPSSPVSPGSKIVKVAEDPSLMEEGIFKDCWSDFSNTLQDVAFKASRTLVGARTLKGTFNNYISRIFSTSCK
ncbi:hypothetical protein Avbf_04185 [Armadillidium vulgare]|nr:hypothetical protein Avbf_04185 [Armadillidium vulgare]